MKNTDGLYVDDIIESIEIIIYYLQKYTIDGFLKDRVLIDAIIRRYSVVGEADSHVSETTKNLFPKIDWKQMKGMRNYVIHQYGKIDYNLLFDTAKNILPTQLQYLKEIDLSKI